MGIEKLDHERIELIRTKVLSHDEAIKSGKVNVYDPTSVIDTLVGGSIEAGECPCPKHTGHEIITAVGAIALHDLLDRPELEWSDRQKATLSALIFSMSSAAVSTIDFVADNYKDLYRARAATALLAGAQDPERVKGALKKAVSELGTVPEEVAQLLGIDKLIGAIDESAKKEAVEETLGDKAEPKPSRRGRPRKPRE